MGWLIGWRTKDELVKHLLEPSHTPRHVMLDHAVVGNHLWVLYEDKESGERSINLNLLTGGPRGSGPPGRDWGYKDICETSGPCQYDCPERLLKQSTCQDHYAPAWREECRAWRKEQAARTRWLKSLKHGDTFFVGEHKLSFVNPNGRYTCRGNYVIGRTDDGNVYRWRKRQVSPNPPAQEG